MEILCAYIRQNAPALEDMDWPAFPMSKEEEDGPLPADWDERLETWLHASIDWLADVKPRADIQKALDVIGRRTPAQLEKEAHWNGADGSRPSAGLPDPDDRPLTEAEREMLSLRRRSAYAGNRLDLRDSTFAAPILPARAFRTPFLKELGCSRLTWMARN